MHTQPEALSGESLTLPALLLLLLLLCRDEVIERIEQLAFDLISGAAAGQLPTLSCVSTARSNVHMAPRNSTLTTTASMLTQGLGASRYTQQGRRGAAETQGFGRSNAGGASAEEDEEEGLEGTKAAAVAVEAADRGEQQHVLRLGSKTQTKSLMANAGAQANSIVRGEQMLFSGPIGASALRMVTDWNVAVSSEEKSLLFSLPFEFHKLQHMPWRVWVAAS